jgi:hypothetical protein
LRRISAQGQLQSQASERNPWLFDGLQDIVIFCDDELGFLDLL